MKIKKTKMIVLVVISLILVCISCYILNIGLGDFKMSKGVQDEIKYIDDISIEIYQFSERSSAQNVVEKYKVESTNSFIDIMPTENVFVEAYLCNSNPDIQYIANGTYNGNTKYRATIKNGDINTIGSFSTYQLSKFFVEKNLVELVDGRMIDFTKKNTEYIEILVTENSPLNIDDEVYFTVNGLDDEFKQIVVRAKVVGIVKKGTFLYGAPDYCGHIKSMERLYYYIFERPTIFTGDISYLYEYEQSPNSLLDENIPVFLLSVDNNNDSLNKFANKNNGEKVTLNVTTADYIQDGAPDVTTSIISIVCCLILMLAIVVTNIILLIKFFKKDEKGVINKH